MNHSIFRILALAIVIIATMSCRGKTTSVKDASLKDSVVIATPPKTYHFATVNKYMDSISQIVLRQNVIGRINKFKALDYDYTNELTYLGKINSKVGVLKFVYNKGYKGSLAHLSSGFWIYDDNNGLIGNYGFGYQAYELRISEGDLYIEIPNCKESLCNVFKDSIPNCLIVGDTLNDINCSAEYSFHPVYREDIKHYGTFKHRW